MHPLNNSCNHNGTWVLLIAQPRHTDTQTLNGVCYTDIISLRWVCSEKRW